MVADGTNRNLCERVVRLSRAGSAMSLLLILPVIVAIVFFLIADIGNPRGGVIRVLPQNLVALSQSIKAQ